MLFHVIVLCLHFVPVIQAAVAPIDPGLEIILVNAKHEKRPSTADALAQVNLEGGGMHDQGARNLPLPDMRRSEDGDSVLATQRKIQELEERQRNCSIRCKPKPNSNHSVCWIKSRPRIRSGR